MSSGAECRGPSDCGPAENGLTCAYGAGGPGYGTGVCVPKSQVKEQIVCSNDTHCGMPGTGETWCCKKAPGAPTGVCEDTRQCWNFNCKTVASGVKSKHVEHFDACVRAAVAAGTGSTGYGEGLYPAVNACMQECYPGPSHANGNTSGSGGGGHEISPLNKPQKLKHHYFHENTWLTYIHFNSMSCNPYFCRQNGSWYPVPDAVRQPGRFAIPSQSKPSSTSVFDHITHYAVEMESAHHSAKKQYTIVPHYMHASAGVVVPDPSATNQGQVSDAATAAWMPHASVVTASLAAKNNRSINDILYSPTKPSGSNANF